MSYSRRRDVLKAAGTVVVVGGLAGCAEQDDDGGGEEEPDDMETTIQDDGQSAAVRVAHLSPDAPNVDILVDGEPAIEDLGYGEVSPYQELEPGTYQVQVTATGDPETVAFEEDVEIQEGMTSTAVAYGVTTGGPEDGFTVDVLEDDLADPGEEMSRVRLFHASPDAGEIDVVALPGPEGGGGQEADPVFEGIAYGDAESQELSAMEYTLGVVPAENGDGQPVAEFDLLTEPQTVYSAFAIGYVTPEEAEIEDPPGFEVVVTEDAQGGERAEGSAGGDGMASLSH